jgi:hypothetical protein
MIVAKWSNRSSAYGRGHHECALAVRWMPILSCEHDIQVVF